MPKTTYNYSAKEYFKYLRHSWLVIVIALIIGCAGGYYFGFQKDADTYTSKASVIFYNDKVELNVANSAHNQFVAIIKSENIYKELKYDIKEYDFGGLDVTEGKAGVYNISTTSSTPEMSIKTTDFIVKHASEVVKKTYGDNSGYHVMLTSGPTSAEKDITTRDRVISMALVVVLAVFVAFAGIFVRFNTIAKK